MLFFLNVRRIEQNLTVLEISCSFFKDHIYCSTKGEKRWCYIDILRLFVISHAKVSQIAKKSIFW